MKHITPLRIGTLLIIIAGVYFLFSTVNKDMRLTAFGIFMLFAAVFAAVDALLLLIKNKRMRLILNSSLCIAMLFTIVSIMVK